MISEAEDLAQAQPADAAWALGEAGDAIAARKVRVKDNLTLKSAITFEAGRFTRGLFRAAQELERRAAKAEGILKQIQLIRAADLYEDLMSKPDSQERSRARERLRAISKELGEFIDAMRYPSRWLDLVEVARTKSVVGYGSPGVITRDKGPFNLAGHRPRWGFTVHARSVLAFNLRGKFRTFQTGFAMQDRGKSAHRVRWRKCLHQTLHVERARVGNGDSPSHRCDRYRYPGVNRRVSSAPGWFVCRMGRTDDSIKKAAGEMPAAFYFRCVCELFFYRQQRFVKTPLLEIRQYLGQFLHELVLG